MPLPSYSRPTYHEKNTLFLSRKLVFSINSFCTFRLMSWLHFSLSCIINLTIRGAGQLNRIWIVLLNTLERESVNCRMTWQLAVVPYFRVPVAVISPLRLLPLPKSQYCPPPHAFVPTTACVYLARFCSANLSGVRARRCTSYTGGLISEPKTE